MKTEIDSDKIELKFKSGLPAYTKLERKLKDILSDFMDEVGVRTLPIEGRIKSFESFWRKAERKKYKDPLTQIEDICALRIIYVYENDFARIHDKIEQEFKLLEYGKRPNYKPIENIGYRSDHYILQLPKTWCHAPDYRDLDNLKFELQVRTILMHAWASINHELAYKSQDQIPNILQNDMLNLSETLEDADKQIVQIRAAREQYRELIKKDNMAEFDATVPKDLDTLQAFLDFKWADRKREDWRTSDLLQNLSEAKITFHDIVMSYEKTKDDLHRNEIEGKREGIIDKGGLAQDGMVELSLILTSDKYWSYKKPYVHPKNLPFLEKCRQNFRDHYS